MPENPQELRDYFDSKVCLKVAQQMLGTAGYYHFLDGQVLAIEELATMQGFRIGQVLLQSVLDDCQAVVAALLSRRQSVTFYEACGFSFVPLRRGKALLKQRQYLKASLSELADADRLERHLTALARSIGFHLPLMIKVL